MSDIAIKVENLSKLYQLGEVGTGTISHDLNRWWAKIQGKEDPYAKIGQTNDRSKKAESDFVWALKDINFEVKQGEVLGIIGRNGAGKSTLLKILSKITSPTTGKIYTKGRIASLLEVGTGFHPEMTGRENIYLNGAILGMRKWEIDRKFDEIVDFAGVEAYIDTPVKRYSSGMYVRLAFAVAAFLEPEILIVDEVLAVGDAEFQKKCLGRMKDVSVNDGRTVLFVSHNMSAISSLCLKTLLLSDGKLNKIGDVQNIVEAYCGMNKNLSDNLLSAHRSKGNYKAIKKGWFEDDNGLKRNKFKIGENISICFEFLVEKKIDNPLFGFGIENYLGSRIFSLNNEISGSVINNTEFGAAVCRIENFTLIPGKYYVSISIVSNQVEWIDYIEQALEFEIIDSDFFGSGKLIDLSQGNVLFKGDIKVIEYGSTTSL